MTTQEFSDKFDTLLDAYGKSYASLRGIQGNTWSPEDLDEYEKSVYLTEAQNFLVMALYNGTYTGESLEQTEELRRSLDSLICSANPETTTGTAIAGTLYKLPEDTWYIIYEAMTIGESDEAGCYGGNAIPVSPVRHDEYLSYMANPFRKPNEHRAFRLDVGDKTVEIISAYSGSYFIRYLRKPKPIILLNLEGNLSIEGETTEQTCELTDRLHLPILENAVKLALAKRKLPETTKQQ